MFDLYEQSISVGPLKIAGAFGLIALLLLAMLVLYSSGAADPVEAQVKGHSFRIEKLSRSTEGMGWRKTYPARQFRESPRSSYEIPVWERQTAAGLVVTYASLEIEKRVVEKIVLAGSGVETVEAVLTRKFKIEKGSFYLFSVDGRRFLIHFGSEEEMYFFEQ